jgi:sigma-B regulation protein RsbU (phosphoserine phosphatase)
VAVAIARRLTNPLVYLTRKVSQFASGDLNVVANVRSNDEIGALAGSFNQMAHQLRESFTNLERANEELETRVEQRTRELREANDRITQLNTQLQTENLRLGAELDVARQLQRMILPREEELRSVVPLEIAGFMEPADEVGGDYYDVLQHDGKVVIGIGDVTGHGLESGVVMIMAQTAVRALTAVNEADPVKFLNALNHTIYANTQRMKSGKNMTLSLMEYKNGAIYVTGQHEDIIIVRQDGDVENVDTFDLGFPLGIESDISAYITQTEIRLQPGDIAVMYTDGITEATSPDQKLYGLEPLYDVLKRYRHCSANEIRQAVIQDVRRHIGTQKLFDDITLVVIKQKQEATAQS